MKNRTLNRISLIVCTASVLGTFVSSQVFAAGFEKSVFWSGHYSALAGAAQSSATGPEALYWNPAGLAGSEGLQIGGDFSPTLSKFSGQVPNGGAALLAAAGGASAAAAQTAAQTNPKSITSNTTFTPVGAAFISYGITPQWGVGIGYDVVGGTRADYDSVDFGFPSGFITPPLKADLSITELSLGTGYEVMPGLKIGAAYRLTFVHADLDVASSGSAGGNATFTSVQLAGLSQTAWNGFRAGLEYNPKDCPWGFGATWRSRVNFNATGSSSISTTIDGPSTGNTPVTQATTTGSGNVGGALPMRIDAATHYIFNPSWTGFAGYSFTNYDQDQALNFSAQSVSSAVPLVWSNMHNVRAAVEYNGIDGTPIRFGYVWTSQVTSAGNASPVLASPGTGNTFVLGTAHKLTPNLTIDAAFEYSRDSGSVAAADLNGGAATTATGDYTAKAYALHLGATFAL